jgi:hypothetical protein
LTLDASFKVLENNTSPNENRPRIDFYWSGHLQRERISVPFSDETSNVRVTGKIAEQNCPLPENAALCMQSFAERVNEYGVPCVTDAGTAFITLGDLTAHNFKRNGAFVRQVPMLMRTAGNFVKSVIEFRVNSLTFTGGSKGTLPIDLQLAPCPINGGSAGEQLAEYIQNTMRMSHELEDAFEGTGNMRVPFNYSETGFQMLGPQLALPAVSYTMIDIPVSNDAFWNNALRCVLARHNQNPESIQTRKQQAILAMRICVFAIQCKPYIGDTIDKNVRGAMRPPNSSLVVPYENFGEALIGSHTAASAGDCEDLARGILIIYLAFIGYAFPAGATLLRACQAILREYVPLMVLACVHGQQLSDSDKNKVGGAHMTMLMFPMHYFKACLERSEEGARLSRMIPWPSKDKMGYGLPCQIGEGTGMLEVEAGADPKATFRAQVYSKMSSLAGLKKWLFQPLDSQGKATESRFFMAALEGFTPTLRHLFGRPEYGGFWLMNKDNKRGALFVDFLDQTDNFVLLPHPKMPEAVMQLIAEGMQMVAPSDPLTLSSVDAPVPASDIRLLDKLVSRTASLGRTPKENAYVSAFVSPHQMSETLGNDMWKDIQKYDFICAVSYDVERVTDMQPSYRVKFHL